MAYRIDPDIRDFYASQILNAYIISTANKKMTLVSRIKKILGMKIYVIDYDFNGEQMVKKAFELADFIIKERNSNNEA